MTLGPGETRRIRVKAAGAGASSVVFCPPGALQNRNAQNRTLGTRYRGSYDQPGAAVLVVGK